MTVNVLIVVLLIGIRWKECIAVIETMDAGLTGSVVVITATAISDG